MTVLNRRYRLARKGHELGKPDTLAELIAYCLEGEDSDLPIRIGDYVLTAAEPCIFCGYPLDENQFCESCHERAEV